MDKTVYEAVIEALVEKLKAATCLSDYYREKRDEAEKQLDALRAEHLELQKQYGELDVIRKDMGR